MLMPELTTSLTPAATSAWQPKRRTMAWVRQPGRMRRDGRVDVRQLELARVSTCPHTAASPSPTLRGSSVWTRYVQLLWWATQARRNSLLAASSPRHIRYATRAGSTQGVVAACEDVVAKSAWWAPCSRCRHPQQWGRRQFYAQFAFTTVHRPPFVAAPDTCSCILAPSRHLCQRTRAHAWSKQRSRGRFKASVRRRCTSVRALPTRRHKHNTSGITTGVMRK